ncbi:MAG TPA: hypothetical protein VFB27_05605 [Opitutaceae bacterium]|nr:hypothetical protein [Opitutaceae bacterium]
MKNITPPIKGKIFVHGRGIGPVSADAIERRAWEIARIEGHHAVSPDHRRQAEEELTGAALPPTANDDLESTDSLSRDPSDPPVERGVESPTHEAPDEQKAAERLVEEGVEEAQHEQMLEARRWENS